MVGCDNSHAVAISQLVRRGNRGLMSGGGSRNRSCGCLGEELGVRGNTWRQRVWEMPEAASREEDGAAAAVSGSHAVLEVDEVDKVQTVRSRRTHDAPRNAGRKEFLRGSDAVVVWALAVFLCLSQPSCVTSQPVWTRLVTFPNATYSSNAIVSANLASWCASYSCASQDRYSLLVGERLEFNMTALHILPNGNLSIAVLADPGLPSGCRVASTETFDTNVSSLKARMRRLTFTPVSGQEGIVYKLCFKVTDTNLPLVSLSKCVTLNVSAPVVKFSDDTAATVERAVGVNCPVLLRLIALDGGGNNYCMAMFQGRNSDPSRDTLPPGAQLSAVGVQASEKRGSHDGCMQAEWLVSWYPLRGQEAKAYTFCMHARDTMCLGYRCAQRGRELCYNVRVEKCKYCLSMGETIMHAAARYKTDWIQIWGANSYIVTPDAIPAWTSLQLGPIYSVRAGDTLEDIAVRFGTTSNNLLEANPDIRLVNDQGLINMGDEICVLPYVCTFGQMTSASGAYRDVSN